MTEKRSPLLGSDGELLVPVKVEKSDYHPDNPNLNRRLTMMVLLLILIFAGTALVVLLVRANIKPAASSSPDVAVVPARFVTSPYGIQISVDPDAKKSATLPCTSRRIYVTVEGTTPVKLHLWSMPDHGSANMEVSLSATQRKAVFDIPAEQGDLFGLALNDTQDNPLTGLEKIGIGTSQIPICDLGVTIRKFR